MGVFHAIAVPPVEVNVFAYTRQTVFFTWATRQPGAGSPGDDPLRSRTQLRLRSLHVYFANVGAANPDLSAEVRCSPASGVPMTFYSTLDTNKMLPLDPQARRTNLGAQYYRITGNSGVTPLYGLRDSFQFGVVRNRRPYHATWTKKEAPRLARLDDLQWGMTMQITPFFTPATALDALVGAYLHFEETQF